MNKKSSHSGIFESGRLVFLLLLLFLSMRFLYLDSDPSFLKRPGDTTDEGLWVHNARSIALFDKAAVDDFTQPLYAVPLNSMLTTLSFELFGVGTYQARIPSALAGFFTLVVLYFFIKETWNKKAALASLLILGFNNAFFMYNRIAINISLTTFLLTLTLYTWYKGKEKKPFYFVSGIVFGLAILAKLTSVYFSIALFILITIQYFIRKEISLKDILLFGLGTFFTLLPFAIFLFVYWDIFAVNFAATTGYNILRIFVPNFFRLLSNNLFGLPTVLFLVLMTLFYFVKSNRFKELRTMPFSHVAAISWIIGILIGLVFSDVHDRRFFNLLVPMTILSTALFFESSSFDFSFLSKKITDLFQKNMFKSFLSSLLISLPFVIVATTFASLTVCNPVRTCPQISIWIILSYLLLSFIVFCILLLFSRYTEKVAQLFVVGSILLLFLIPFLTLARHFARHIAVVTSTLSFEVIYIGALSLLIGTFFFIVTLLFTLRPSLSKISQRTIFGFFATYFVLSTLIISFTLLFPSFTVMESSESLGLIVDDYETITGILPHTFALENKLVPIFFQEDQGRIWEEVNREYDLDEINYVAVYEIINGKPIVREQHIDHRDFVNPQLVYQASFFKYPFTNKYKEVISVYRVEGYI